MFADSPRHSTRVVAAARSARRNAEVRVVTGPSVASGDGGVHRVSGVMPGEVTMMVTYTGFQPATATL